MTTKLYYLTIALILFSNWTQAQTLVKSTDVMITNLGNNQLFIEYIDKTKNPISGKIRIINEALAEQIDTYLKKGYPEGKYETFINNQLKELMTFKNGYMDGPMITYFPNGDKKYEISFKNGIRDGYARVYSAQGELMVEKFYAKGQLSGKVQAIMMGSTGLYRKICYYKEGLLDGEYYEEWIKNKTQKTKGYYNNGVKNGKWTEWTEN